MNQVTFHERSKVMTNTSASAFSFSFSCKGYKRGDNIDCNEPHLIDPPSSHTRLSK